MISETVVMMRRAPKPRAMEGSENIASKEERGPRCDELGL